MSAYDEEVEAVRREDGVDDVGDLQGRTAAVLLLEVPGERGHELDKVRGVLRHRLQRRRTHIDSTGQVLFHDATQPRHRNVGGQHGCVARFDLSLRIAVDEVPDDVLTTRAWPPRCHSFLPRLSVWRADGLTLMRPSSQQPRSNTHLGLTL